MFSMGEFQEVALKEMGHNVKYVIPKEGGIGVQPVRVEGIPHCKN